MSNPLAAIEAVHGFRFGNAEPTTAGAPMTGTLVCPNPTCENHHVHVAVHEDTVLPVHCGRCFTVLLEDPNRAPDASLIVGDPERDFLNALIQEQVQAAVKAALEQERRSKKNR